MDDLKATEGEDRVGWGVPRVYIAQECILVCDQWRFKGLLGVGVVVECDWGRGGLGGHFVGL